MNLLCLWHSDFQPKVTKSKDVLVLYLYGNLIQRMENLDNFTNLMFLYLQKNQICVMENLQNLKNLKKLYIGHNNINVLEGLTKNNQLEELHIEKQIVSEGSPFCFDPRSLTALKVSSFWVFRWSFIDLKIR